MQLCCRSNSTRHCSTEIGHPARFSESDQPDRIIFCRWRWIHNGAEQRGQMGETVHGVHNWKCLLPVYKVSRLVFQRMPDPTKIMLILAQSDDMIWYVHQAKLTNSFYIQGVNILKISFVNSILFFRIRICCKYSDDIVKTNRRPVMTIIIGRRLSVLTLSCSRYDFYLVFSNRNNTV